MRLKRSKDRGLKGNAALLRQDSHPVFCRSHNLEIRLFGWLLLYVVSLSGHKMAGALGTNMVVIFIKEQQKAKLGKLQAAEQGN